MRGLDWGRLYESYHWTSYNAAASTQSQRACAATRRCTTTKGIYEYLLGGETNPSCLTFASSSEAPNASPTSNRREGQGKRQSRTARCARLVRCATRPAIYKQNEMDADHVTAWSKGGCDPCPN